MGPAVRLAILVLHLLLLAVGAMVSLPDGFVHDDVYITFRYAQHLAAGDGLTFAPGERHLGTTAPLYAGLLALGHLVTGATIEQVAAGLHVVALLLLAWILDRVVKRWSASGSVRVWVVLAPWLLLLTPLLSEVAGMETLLFATTSLAVLASAWLRWPLLAGFVGVLAGLLRPGGAFVVVLALGYLVAVDRRAARRMLIAAVVAGTPWLVYATLQFGSPLPATIAAKAGQSQTSMWLGYADYLVLMLGPAWRWSTALLIAVGGLCFGGSYGRLVVLWALIHNGVYVLAGAPAYPWYILPLLVQGAAAAALAAVGIARRVVAAWPTLARGGAAAALQSSAVLLAVGLMAAVVVQRSRPTWLPTTLEPTSNRYWRMAQWLRQTTPPDAAVATMEVGIVGYYSQRPIVDFLGLVTPGIAPLVPQGQNVAAAMARFRPPWVLLHRPPWAKFEDDLPQYLHADYVHYKTVEDCELWLRWRPSASELAAAIAAAVPAGGRVAFLGAPPAVELELVQRALVDRGSNAVLTSNAFDGCEHWLQLAPDGRLRAVPALPQVALRHAGADFAAWRVDQTESSADADGLHWSQPVPVLSSPPLDLPGPVAAVRLDLTIESIADPAAAAAWFTWRSSADPVHVMATVVRLPAPSKPGRHQLIMRPKRAAPTVHVPGASRVQRSSSRSNAKALHASASACCLRNAPPYARALPS